MHHTIDATSLAELLLDEFTHRINNELATLIAIVSREQAMNQDEATRRALKRVHARLVSVGRVQHALQGPRGDTDAADYLRQLCESRRTMLENADVRFAGCSVKLDAERCRRLGMIVSELVENARKHAFAGAGPGSTSGVTNSGDSASDASISGGSISVELSVRDGQIECRVSDNGRGYFGASGGRGLSIVHALAHSLNGRLSHQPAKAGTAWLLTMPH